MSIQIIHGGNGVPTGVFIPMIDWEEMKKQNSNLIAWEDGINKSASSVSVLRGKLNLSEEEYKDFQNYAKKVRKEWE